MTLLCLTVGGTGNPNAREGKDEEEAVNEKVACIAIGFNWLASTGSESRYVHAVVSCFVHFLDDWERPDHYSAIRLGGGIQ